MRIGLFVAVFLVVSGFVQSQTLDETWTVMVGTQAVQVNPDGSFRIPNIPSPDQFGPGGPGTRPDFLSDDFLRLTGFSTVGGQTRYVYSDPFQIRQGESFHVGRLTFTDEPPPLTNSLRVTIDTPALTAIDQTAQLTVTATLADGAIKDVTSRSLWTVYRTSNTDVVTVGRDGRVTAKGRGTAFITVVNEGTTSVIQVDVVPGEALTTVSGFVRRADESPVPGILVRLIGVAGTVETDAQGRFDIAGVATSGKIKGVYAVNEAGERLIGIGQSLEPFPDGVTDGGVIVVRSLCEALDGECDDADGDCLPDSVEVALELDPNNPDTNGNSVKDGELDPDGDGLDHCTEIFLKTNPMLADTDGDGIDDADEVFLVGTDPLSVDSDFDALDDGEEWNLGVDGVVTDPLHRDTDRDGWNDEVEVTMGSDPTDALSRPRPFAVSTISSSVIRPVFIDPSLGEFVSGVVLGEPTDIRLIRTVFVDPTIAELRQTPLVATPTVELKPSN